MHNATELDWGLKHKDIEAPVLWGARVLVEPGYRGKETYSLLWDRQGAVGTEEQKKALQIALNKGAIGALFDHFKEHLEDDNKDHFIVLKGVRFWYSTHRSCGYVYVTAIPA